MNELKSKQLNVQISMTEKPLANKFIETSSNYKNKKKNCRAYFNEVSQLKRLF